MRPLLSQVKRVDFRVLRNAVYFARQALWLTHLHRLVGCAETEPMYADQHPGEIREKRS